MGAIRTSLKLIRLAGQGATLRDRCLAFFCSGLGVIGSRRRRIRRGFIVVIGSFGRAGQVRLQIRKGDRPVRVAMRQGNVADYLVVGELLMGGYSLPPEVRARPTAIVDGGANIGVFALQAATRFPGVRLTCYEPDTANLVQLRRNVDENQIAAEIVPKALWSRTADLFFHPGESYTGYVSGEPSPYPISCILPSVPEGCWLKLDIEGAEYEVLPALLAAGARPAIISMEIHDFNRRGEGLLTLLKQREYTIIGSFKAEDVCVVICAYLAK